MKKLTFLLSLVVLSFCATGQNTLNNLGLTSSTPSAAAYSVRLLSSSYTGPLVRITIGSNYYDVYPDATSGQFALTSKISALYASYNAAATGVTVNALSSVIGSSSATVAIWYDQSGNVRDASQATTASQPNIITAGTITRKNNMPSVYFNIQNLATVPFSGAYSTAYTLAVCGGINVNTTYSTFGAKCYAYLPSPFDSYNSQLLTGNAATANSANLTNGINVASGFSQWVFQADATTATGFRNGVANGTGAVTAYSDANSTALIIGSRTDGVTSLNGWVSEFVTFGSKLSTTDRQTLETNQMAAYFSTSANLSSLTTTAGSISPTFAVATTAYTASVVNSTTSITVTPATSANATIQVQVNSGGYATVASGSASSALALNVGSNAIDIKVTSQDGTTIKTYTITVTRGTLGNALHFDGTDDRILVPDNTSLRLSAGSFTVEFWAKPTIVDGTYHWVVSKDADNSHLDYILGVDNINKWHFYGRNLAIDVIGTTTVVAGNWYHVACSFNGTIATLYVNGVAEGTDNTVGSAFTSTANLLIGARSNASTPSEFFGGTVDELRIWNIARTQAQVQASMSNELLGTELGVVAYYRFNQGTASGTNTGINTLIDALYPASNNGSLGSFFALANGTSNWVAGNVGIGVISTDATLSTLTTTAGTVSPTFAAATIAYTASVANAVTSITVTPTMANFYSSIQVQVNSGGYATVASGTASSALALNVGSNAIDVKVTAQDGITIKTYTITVTRAAAPLITATGSLTAFSSCAGAASAQQSFTVAGSNLIADITITPPTGFEVSTTSGSGFASSITLTQTGGTVNTTTVYVRLTTAATGTPSGNIACASTGATTQSLAASGTVNAVIAGNSLGSPQTVCSGSTPATFTGSTPTGGSGSYSYVWLSSTTSNTTGFSPATGTNDGKDYSPGAATLSTWYRRVVNSGSCVDTTSLVVNGVYASSFPGSPGYVSIAGGTPVSIQGTTSKYVGMWVYPTSYTVAAGLFNFGNGAACYASTRFSITTTGFLKLDQGCGTQTSTISVPQNQWTYVFMSFNSTTQYTVGKVSNGTVTKQNILTSTSASHGSGPFNIGANTINANYFTGQMDEVSVWSKNPTDAEIVAMSQNGLIGTETSLVGYWNFNAGPGNTTVTDNSGHSLTGTLTNINSTSGWVTSTITFPSPSTVTVNPKPTITLGAVANVTATATSFSLPYSAVTGSPNQYSITTGTNAMTSFSTVSNASLPVSPISVTIPASAGSTYDFVATVNNGTTGCISDNNNFTVRILPTATITNFGNISKIYYDLPFALTAPTSNSTGAFTYTSSNTAVATISGSTVTIVAAGTSTITATQAADANYSSSSIAATLTVTSVTVVTKNGQVTSTGTNYVGRNGNLNGGTAVNAQGQIAITQSTPDGLTSGTAATSAAAIKLAYPSSADGVYWINVPGYGPKQTYCLMNSTYDGGGWMLAFKATTGTTFNYDATYWTTANTLNPTDVTRNNADAKYDIMNGFAAKDVLAIWPDITNIGTESGSIDNLTTWTWLQNSYNSGSSTTLISRFAGVQSTLYTSTNGSMTYNGYGTPFSNQGGFTFYGFNYTTLASARVRWGFAWNNETDQTSNDVSGGIGMSTTYGTYSAGDRISCCQSNTGINRSARVEMYIR